MNPHLPLIVLCCLSMQLTAQIKNTYSFAQGDTTQVVITWDAWAETGDPILGCNVYRYEDQTNPINTEIITSNDSIYLYVDATCFDPCIPPKYIIKAWHENNEYTIAKASAFSSIEFFTIEDDIIKIHLHLWNKDVEMIGMEFSRNGLLVAFLEYPFEDYFDFNYYSNFPFKLSWEEDQPFIIDYLTQFTPNFPQPIESLSFSFHYLDTPISYEVYAEITFKSEFFDYLATTVGIPSAPEAGMDFSVYPNPLTEVATINFYLPEPSNTLLALYDIGGRMVKTLHQGSLSSGRHTFELERGQLPQGFYFLKLNSEFGNIARKIVVY
jgi:hypothetical protein